MSEDNFYQELQDIRNGYHQLYKNNKYINFIEQYQEDIIILYNMLSKYYYVDYNQFLKFIYLSST